jgi:uncharacterized protein YfaS (alpha-2-macroglobulin family)
MSFYDNLYVAGGSGNEMKQQKVDYIPTDTLTIIPNATHYQPDDACELLVLAPFSPASGLVILDCEGQISNPIEFQIEAGKDSATVEFKISKDWIPGFTAHVEVAGSIRWLSLTRSVERYLQTECCRQQQRSIANIYALINDTH